MLEWSADPNVVAAVDAEMQQWWQGDVAGPGVMLWIADRDRPLTPETGELVGTGPGSTQAGFDYVAVVSQTCDIQRSCAGHAPRPFVQISAVVTLAGPELKEAAGAHTPRYAPLPGLGPDKFADLDRCTTVEKTVIERALEHLTGCPDDKSKLAFARAVGRQRQRFPFPAGLDSALGALRTRFREKRNSSGPEGLLLREVREIRAHARNGWSATPVALTLTFLIAPASLPAVDPDDPAAAELLTWLETDRAINELAARLVGSSRPADRSVLWQHLAGAWAALCAGDAITDLDAFAESSFSYSIERSWQEPKLDLEHLS